MMRMKDIPDYNVSGLTTNELAILMHQATVLSNRIWREQNRRRNEEAMAYRDQNRAIIGRRRRGGSTR